MGALQRTPGTLVVEHRFDGHVVRRTTAVLTDGVLTSTECRLELAHGCVSCTIRNDLLVLLRQLHRRDDVDRIVVRLAPWLEPEPICLAINHVRVRVAPGGVDGPTALDVSIAAVVTCVDSSTWLSQALGEDELDGGRTHAQVVIGQAEFADVVGAPARWALPAPRRRPPRRRRGWPRWPATSSAPDHRCPWCRATGPASSGGTLPPRRPTTGCVIVPGYPSATCPRQVRRN
ncbi:hypothetical protein MLM_0504 [Mycobacterium lepraemurium]|nr:hypothetical protein MLM_0504 [Mycobacterium lepraemurium]